MKSQRLLLTAAYLVVVSIAVFTLVDAVLAVWPINLGETAWRFGAVGMISRHLISLLLAMLLATGVASFAGHRSTLRVCGVLCALAALVLLPVAVFFLLDVMELRASVQPAMLRPFELSAAAALFKILVGMLVVLVLGVAGWREASRVGFESAAVPAPDMLVGSRH